MSGLRCRACDEPVWTAKVSGRRLSGKLGEIYKVAAGNRKQEIVYSGAGRWNGNSFGCQMAF